MAPASDTNVWRVMTPNSAVMSPKSSIASAVSSTSASQKMSPQSSVSNPSPDAVYNKPKPVFSYANAASIKPLPPSSTRESDSSMPTRPVPDAPNPAYRHLGWQGAANIARWNSPAPSVQPHERPLPTSRATSPAMSMARSTASMGGSTHRSVPRTVAPSSADTESGFKTVSYGSRTNTRSNYRSDSHTQRSTSPSETSDHSTAFQAAHTQQPQIGSINDPVVQVDTSGWTALMTASTSANTAGGSSTHRQVDVLSGNTGDAELDNMVRDLKALRVDPTLPSPTQTGAWTFKKSVVVEPGARVDPSELRYPSDKYLEFASIPTKSISPIAFAGKRPKLIVLDLNNTLLSRRTATSKAARNATMRPYLGAFLEYLCGTEEVGGVLQRRFNVMVWSSAKPENVQVMCGSMGLTSETGSQAPLLLDMWARDSLDLSHDEYLSKVPDTIKNLAKIWQAQRWTVPGSDINEAGEAQLPVLEKWSQMDTILVDDSPGKACLQPYNHIIIPPFNANNFKSFNSSESDHCLIQLIGMLAELKLHTNVSSAIKSGTFSGLGKGDVQYSWKRRGEDVCKSLGIPMKKEFDRTWSDRLLSSVMTEKPVEAAHLYDAPKKPSVTQAIGWD